MPELDADLATAVAGLRADAARADWPGADEIRVRGDRRTNRRRLAAAVVTVAACAAVIAAVAVAQPRLRQGPPPAATPTTGLGTAVLRSLTPLEHPVEPTAVAVGQGSLWLAFRADPGHPAPPVPGELVRLDLASLNVTATWPVVGSPAAMVVTPSGVWVAGDVYDGKTAVVGANTVQQFRLDGTLRHTYDVIDPLGLVADGDAVWVQHGESNGSATFVSRLHDGAVDAPVRLSGSHPMNGQSMAVCPDGLYVASQVAEAASTHVQRIGQGPVPGEALVDQTGFVSITCRTPGVVLSVTSDTAAVYRLPFDGGRATKMISLPQPARVLATAGDLLWLGTNADADSSRIWAMDAGSGNSGVGVTVPAEIVHGVAEGTRLWAVGYEQSRPGEWIIAAVTVS